MLIDRRPLFCVCQIKTLQTNVKTLKAGMGLSSLLTITSIYLENAANIIHGPVILKQYHNIHLSRNVANIKNFTASFLHVCTLT